MTAMFALAPGAWAEPIGDPAPSSGPVMRLVMTALPQAESAAKALRGQSGIDPHQLMLVNVDPPPAVSARDIAGWRISWAWLEYRPQATGFPFARADSPDGNDLIYALASDAAKRDTFDFLYFMILVDPEVDALFASGSFINDLRLDFNSTGTYYGTDAFIGVGTTITLASIGFEALGSLNLQLVVDPAISAYPMVFVCRVCRIQDAVTISNALQQKPEFSLMAAEQRRNDLRTKLHAGETSPQTAAPSPSKPAAPLPQVHPAHIPASPLSGPIVVLDGDGKPSGGGYVARWAPDCRKRDNTRSAEVKGTDTRLAPPEGKSALAACFVIGKTGSPDLVCLPTTHPELGMHWYASQVDPAPPAFVCPPQFEDMEIEFYVVRKVEPDPQIGRTAVSSVADLQKYASAVSIGGVAMSGAQQPGQPATFRLPPDLVDKLTGKDGAQALQDALDTGRYYSVLRVAPGATVPGKPKRLRVLLREDFMRVGDFRLIASAFEPRVAVLTGRVDEPTRRAESRCVGQLEAAHGAALFWGVTRGTRTDAPKNIGLVWNVVNGQGQYRPAVPNGEELLVTWPGDGGAASTQPLTLTFTDAVCRYPNGEKAGPVPVEAFKRDGWRLDVRKARSTLLVLTTRDSQAVTSKLQLSASEENAFWSSVLDFARSLAAPGADSPWERTALLFVQSGSKASVLYGPVEGGDPLIRPGEPPLRNALDLFVRNWKEVSRNSPSAMRFTGDIPQAFDDLDASAGDAGVAAAGPSVPVGARILVIGPRLGTSLQDACALLHPPPLDMVKWLTASKARLMLIDIGRLDSDQVSPDRAKKPEQVQECAMPIEQAGQIRSFTISPEGLIEGTRDEVFAYLAHEAQSFLLGPR